MSEKVENLEVDNQFDKLFSERNFIVSSISTDKLLEGLEETHKRNIACIDFLRNKIGKCNDILKSSVGDDIVIKDELIQYEHSLFLVRYCDALMVDLIFDCKKRLNNNG